jgi:hypothetical protein
MQLVGSRWRTGELRLDGREMRFGPPGKYEQAFRVREPVQMREAIAYGTLMMTVVFVLALPRTGILQHIGAAAISAVGVFVLLATGGRRGWSRHVMAVIHHDSVDHADDQRGTSAGPDRALGFSSPARANRW